jgi:hypothetical protein
VVRTDSDVRNLTVKNIGGGATYAGGIVFVGEGYIGPEETIENISVDVGNATNSYGVWNVMGVLSLRHVRVQTTGTMDAVALRHDDDSLGALTRVWESKLVSSHDALHTDGGAVRVTGSVLWGLRYANVPNGEVFLRNSALSGSPSVSGGALNCWGSSTGSAFFTNSCPTEYWSVEAD